MKYILFLLSLGCVQQLYAQNQPHYTMFMYNKLIYNPAYAGSRDVLSLNATYRNQWSGIDGAPVVMNVSADAPIGGYATPFKKVALGLSVNGDKAGTVTNNTVTLSYAYRLQMKKSVMSFGLSAGASIYSAQFSDKKILIKDADDPVLTNDISGRVMPNVGAGLYWYSKRAYIGLSVPAILQNYYDKKQKTYTNGDPAKQIRSYYASAGYTIHADDNLEILPQAMMRAYKGGGYSLPTSFDLNLSLIIYKRVLLGVTNRTDKSIEFIAHLQVAKKLNLGYAYDYLMSDYKSYARNTHEVTLGFDFIKDRKQYEDPRFIKNF